MALTGDWFGAFTEKGSVRAKVESSFVLTALYSYQTCNRTRIYRFVFETSQPVALSPSRSLVSIQPPYQP